ncbi:MAG: M56 family metallopeptidase [Bacteroidota bacterium]
MQHLFQSSFLQALGYAIANSLWQTALVWLIYMSASGLLPLRSAAKYRLAVAAQVTGFLWFIFTFQFYYQQYNNAWQTAGTTQVSQQVQQLVSTNTDLYSRLIHWMVKGEQLLPYISMAYLLLMLVLCIRWIMGYRQTQLIRSNGLQKMPAEWRLFVKKIAARLSIKKEVRIYLSNTISSPLTVGFWKPVILIPVASINHLSTDQLEAVLLHELAHIKRFDYLVNIILSVVEISLFFNPFTQLLSKAIHKERENSCDDWVLQFKYDASVYAEALLRIACLQTLPALAMAATGGKKNELLVRVKRMIDQKENRFSYRRQLLALLIMTGILSSIAWLTPMKPHTENTAVTQSGSTPAQQLLQKKKQAVTEAAQPMAVSVDNPLFNPVFFLSKPLKEEMRKNIASAQKEIEETFVGTDAEHPGFVTSFTPVITDALELASREIGKQLPDWDKNIAAMELAKTTLSNTLRSADTAMANFSMKNKFKEDISTALKNIDGEITKAKQDMDRSKKDNVLINQEKTRQEIEQAIGAIDELKKMGFDKLIINSLRTSEKAMNEVLQPRKRVKAPPVLKTEEAMEKMQISEPAILPKQKMDDEEIKDTPSEDVITVPFAFTPRLVSLDDKKRIKIDAATLMKLKVLLWKRASELGIRIQPPAKKDTPDKAEEKLVIFFQ